MMGPYETEDATYDEPLLRQIRSLRDSARPGQSAGPAVRHHALGHLESVCERAGIRLGAYDREVLAWLAGWEDSVVQVVIGLIDRAAAKPTQPEPGS